jgi:hypothetical protein
MNIVLSNVGRYGDTVLASIVVNMLVAGGNKVKWATSRRYIDLVRAVAPDAEAVIHPHFERHDYTDLVNASVLRELFPGHDAYVNAQFGAREDYCFTSGKHPLHWLRDKVESLTGIRLGTNWKDFLIYRNPSEIRIPDLGGKPLAIISPGAISDYPPVFWLDGRLRKIHDALVPRYDVRLLVENGPENVDGYRHLYGYSFVDAIKVVQQAQLFVGQDSGMSWAALYSPCRKEVWHRRTRYDVYKTSFTEVDPSVIEHFV